jgi:hypothetical protein
MSEDNWHLLVSSNLYGCRYDAGEEVLHVRFKSGSEYQYFDVPEHVFDSLITAESAGKYFHKNIREAYIYERTV